MRLDYFFTFSTQSFLKKSNKSMGAIFPALGIVGVCIFASLGIEFISYLLVYSNENFQPLQDEMKAYNKKITKISSQNSIKNERKNKKELASLKKRLQAASTKLNGLRFKTNFIMPFVLMGLFGILNSSYEGIIIARLPFEPFGFIQSMTLRGIDGIKEDVRDCSFLPLYILSNMGLKPVITKLLGFTPPRSAATKSAWEQANEVATRQQERR